MIQVIRNIVPLKVRIFRSALSIYLYDMKSYLKFSSCYERYDTEQKMKSFITKMYHVVEKGLTMPQTRLGFGKDNVLKLIDLCKAYKSKSYNLSSLEFTHAVATLNEYLKFHEDHNFKIEQTIFEEINALSESTGITKVSQQIKIQKDQFFAKSKLPFDEFCLSRSSVRNFSSKDIPLDILHHCAELAQASPSPCNRQPNRVYIVKDKSTIERILKLQNGNRGFGHLGNAIIVFTSDISVFHDTYERNEMYLNSGMFSMSFIYALHFHQIGSCALNWSVPIHKDKALRHVLGIPDNEVITLTLVCGYVPEQFQVALSPKLGWQQVTTDII